MCRAESGIIFPECIPSDELRQEYGRLYEGLRDELHPVTWRTTCVTIGKLIGVEDIENVDPPPEKFDDALKITKTLLEGTWSEPLLPEILYGVGFDQAKELPASNLDVLLINARHEPEKLLWDTARELRAQGKCVAVINPVGHYGDNETRIVSPAEYFRDIKDVMFVASTQAQKGGSWEVLAKTLRILRNSQLIERIKGKVVVSTPMWGGSRGHRKGQKAKLGYEVLEAPFAAKLVGLITDDIMENVAEDISNNGLPEIIFQTVDIHNEECIRKVFRALRFKFQNLSPAHEFSQIVINQIRERHFTHIRKKLIASDRGAIKRTEELAQAVLEKLEPGSEIDIIYIDKTRKSAGIVGDATINRVERWSIVDGVIQKTPINLDEDKDEDVLLIGNDDMLDTGSTLRKDAGLLEGVFHRISEHWFIATHPVISKGNSVLKASHVNLFIVGNTLPIEEDMDTGELVVAKLARTLAAGLLGGYPVTI